MTVHAYLTTDEVAERYRTAASTVRYWRTLDPPYGPRGVKVGRRVLYALSEIERFEREEGGVLSPPTPPVDDPADTGVDLPAAPSTTETGRFLKAQRERAGLSQADVGKATSLKTQSAVWKIESGRRGLAFHEAVELAALIGFSLDELAECERGEDEVSSEQWWARATAAMEQAKRAREREVSDG